MKKKVLSIILALVMVAGMIPFAAIPAFAASGWQTGEVHGQYGYVKSGEEYYPLNSSSDFGSAFASVKTSYNIHLLSDYTADNLVVDAEHLFIYLNGHTLTVTGDVEVDVYAGEEVVRNTFFAIYGNGGSISFPNNTSTSAFTFGWAGIKESDAYSKVENVTFFNCKGRVLYAESSGALDCRINNCRFENCSADKGSCIYFNNGLITNAEIQNCRFVNCSATDGGAVYIDDVGDDRSNVKFSGCYAVNCRAGGDGGFMYVNDADAKVYGSGNTVISGCTAGDDGGAVYTPKMTQLDGFVFADNHAEGKGGAVFNESTWAAQSTISNCRFYRNTSREYGGAIYVDDDNGTVENCKFFENEGQEYGYSLYSDETDTQIKNCTFTSSYGENAVYNGTQTDCVFPETSSYSLSGDGSQENPYVINNIDDWDAMYYMVKNHSRSEYSNSPGEWTSYGTDAFQGKYVRLDSDITVCNTIGETYTNNQAGYTSKHEFTGTFDGNGHTVTYVYYSDDNADDEKAAFGYANGATVKNLTVNGYIKGSWGIGGIFGHAENSTAENCVNNVEIHNTALYTGGIAGYSAYSNFIDCTNNGKIEGLQSQAGGIAGYAEGDTFNGCTNNGEVITGNQMAGGIAGYAKGNTKILNCINNGTVTATYCYGGGIVGYEDGKVTAANCINTGKINAAEPSGQYPAEGDYVIHSAYDTNYCFDISAVSTEEYGNLNMWNAQNSKAKVFTLKYSDKYGAYYIIAKHSGLALTAEPKKDYSTVDGVNVYQFTAQGLGYQLWNFEASGSSYRIRGVESGFTLNIDGGTASNGTNVIAYKFAGNDSFNLVAEPNQTLKPVYANGITGRHYGGSTYEQCFYDKEKAIGDRYGIGLSTNAMNGLTADENGNLMPYCVNDYIKENNKSKDGWLYAAFNGNGVLEFVHDATAFYMGTDGLLHAVKNALQVTDSMTALGEQGKNTAYYVDGTVTRNGRIQILGNVTLVLNDDCYYDVQGGIGLEKGNSLTVYSYSLGEHMGSMKAAANGGNKGAAAIGGNAANTVESVANSNLSVSSEKHDCGNFTVYGGKIEAIAYSENDMYGVGIGGNSLSLNHSYINYIGVYYPVVFNTDEETFNGGDGGNVKVYNGNLSVKAAGAVGIGGGNGTHFYVKCGSSVLTDKNFNGGNGGTFSFYGGTVTVESDLAAFGKGRNGDGNRDAVTDPNMTAFASTKDGVYGALAGDNLSELKKAYNFDDEAFHLNGEKCVQFGKYGYSYTETLNPTCEAAGHKAYLLKTADNLYYEEGGFNVAIGDTSALQAWISEGGDGYIAPLGHNWVYINENQHKCIHCEKTESHTMGDDGCTKCNGFYYEYSAETQTLEKKAIPSGTEILSDFDGNYTLSGGWYFVHGDVTAAERITCTGDVHLILENGCNFTANKGIALATGVSLTVYAQSFDDSEMGKLTVPYSPGNCAGIGSNQYITCGSVSIHGGIITVTDGSYAAGIGSGYQGSCGNISVYGGVITVNGGASAAGIGSGWSGSCGYISVYGGNITATGGNSAAGIGSGYRGSCGNISVYGGNVTATGGNSAAGIGSGTDGSCESVAISDYLDITAGADKNSAQPVAAYNGEKYVRLTEPSTAAKEPTCTRNGHIEFYKNEGKYYSDEACTNEITGILLWLSTPVENGGGMIPATGIHTDGDGNGYCDLCKIYIETYTGFYDAATETYTLKKASGCSEEALTFSVPLESFAKYIDVTGKAYIDTGYKPATNTHAVMNVNVNSKKEYWFGAWNEDYNKGAFALGNDRILVDLGDGYYTRDDDVYVGYGNDGGGYGGECVSNGRHTVELNKNLAQIDGKVWAALKFSGGFTLDYPLYLFAQNRKGEAFIPDSQKVTCYSFQILEGEQLLHYYIPYVKDGEAGLYDLIEGKFFGNANTVGSITAAVDEVITIPAKEPICGENGYREHYYSTVTDEYFEDADCTVKIADINEWRAIDGKHKWIEAEQNKAGASSLKTEATCAENAVYYKVCSVCDEISSDKIWEKPNTATANHGCKNTVNYSENDGIYTVTEECKNCDYTNEYSFTEYDYIAAEKGAYINTGYKPTGDTRVVMNVFVNGDYEYWFGVWDTDYNKSAFALGNDGRGIYAGYGNQGGTNSNGPLSNGYHTVEMNKNEVYFDGVHYTGIAHKYSSEGFPIQNTLYLFAQNRAGSAFVSDDQSTIYCYGCEIYEGDTLVRKFVPCKNDSGVSGLLDIVNGVFCENSGSASITALNDTFETVSEQKPTCTENGHIEYYRIGFKYYSDSECANEITDLSAWMSSTAENGGGMIPATGHTWEYLNSEKHKCSVCQLEEAHTHNGLGNCAECGAKLYTVTLVNTETSETVYSGNIDCTKGCIIESIANGKYIMTVSCAGMVARTYPIEVIDGRVAETVSLSIEGDVNGDGEITVEDYSAAVNAALASDSAVPEYLTATANYQKAVADLDGDGFVDVLDVALLERKIY